MKRVGAGRPRAEYVPGVSKTDPSFGDEVNVNSVVAKYRRGQQVDFVRSGRGQFMDVSAIPDLHQAFAKVREAEDAFMKLPSVIRERLGNNPANMQDFVLDPRNQDVLVEYGLAIPRETAGSTEPAVSTDVPATKSTKGKSKTPPPEVPPEE